MSPVTTTPISGGSPMMITLFVSCPCSCGEVVPATDAGFAATTVEVDGCTASKAAGIVSRTMRKSWAVSHEVSASSPVRHAVGLVEFAGGF